MLKKKYKMALEIEVHPLFCTGNGVSSVHWELLPEGCSPDGSGNGAVVEASLKSGIDSGGSQIKDNLRWSKRLAFSKGEAASTDLNRGE